MQVTYERCAGLTVRKKVAEVCVLVTRADGTVEKLLRTFSTKIADLLALEEWFAFLAIEHVVMESTGIDGYLVYNLLKDGCYILPIQPRQLKALSGSRIGLHDCEWLAYLLRHDMLHVSFVPPGPIDELHNLLNYRKMLIARRAQEFQHLQTLLEEAELELEVIVTEKLGRGEWLMIDAITGEQRDAEALVKLARGHLRPLFPALRLALDEQLPSHQQFLLQRILTHAEFCEESLTDMQKEIEQRLTFFGELVMLLQTIPGVHLMTAISILSEIGMDMKRFPTHKHLSAWAGMSSGGKRSDDRPGGDATTEGNLHLQAILNGVAATIAQSEETNYLTTLYWHTTYWGGRRRALRAVAHTILVIAYYVMRDRQPYRDEADYLDKHKVARNRLRAIERLEERQYATIPLGSEPNRKTRVLSSPTEAGANAWQLLPIWLWIGLTSFGGGASCLIAIQHEFIEKRNWLTSQEFSHFWSLCGITPGTSQIAMSILIGRKLGGTPGIVASLIGFLLPSTVITYLLAAGFQRLESVPAMQAIWKGLMPATGGLMFLISLRLTRPLLARGRKEGLPALSISLVMILACVFSILILKITAIFVLLVASLVGVILFTSIHRRLPKGVKQYD